MQNSKQWKSSPKKFEKETEKTRRASLLEVRGEIPLIIWSNLANLFKAIKSIWESTLVSWNEKFDISGSQAEMVFYDEWFVKVEQELDQLPLKCSS